MLTLYWDLWRVQTAQRLIHDISMRQDVCAVQHRKGTLQNILFDSEIKLPKNVTDYYLTVKVYYLILTVKYRNITQSIMWLRNSEIPGK